MNDNNLFNQENNVNSYTQSQDNITNNQTVNVNLERSLNDNSNGVVQNANQNSTNNFKKKGKLPVILLTAVLAVGAVAAAMFLLPKGNDTEKDKQLTEAPKDYIGIYKIEDYEKLINGTYDLAKNYILMADLDLEDYCKNNSCKPIGSYQEPFTGIFDGNNHKISNYYYEIGNNETGVISATGFFAKVEKGTIKNLKLEDSKIKLNIDGNNSSTGLLVGISSNSVIENCDVTGIIENEGVMNEQIYSVGLLAGLVVMDKAAEKIEIAPITTPYYDEIPVLAKVVDCNATGKIVLNGIGRIDGIGGLIGTVSSDYHPKHGYNLKADIGNSFANVEIDITSLDYDMDNAIDSARNIGGLLGTADGIYLHQCGSTGNINAKDALYAGGLAGTANSAYIEECYAKGNVTADEGVSGFISQFNQGTGVEAEGIKNSYSTGDVIIKGANAGALPISDIFECNCAAFVDDGDDYINNVFSSGKVIYADTSITYGKVFIGEARSDLKDAYYNYDNVNDDMFGTSAVKLNTNSMLNKSSYSSFDFENVWAIDEGKSTPYFKWEK